MHLPAGLNVLDQKLSKENGSRQLVAVAESANLAETTPRRVASTRIAVKVERKIVFLDAAEIVIVEARGNYVILHQKSGSHRLRLSISGAAESFKPFGFVRIHRSFLVNSAFAEEVYGLSTGEYVLRVRGGRSYTVTRTYKNNLRRLAAAWIGMTDPMEAN